MLRFWFRLLRLTPPAQESNKVRRAGRKNCRPALEFLEGRALLSVSVAMPAPDAPANSTQVQTPLASSTAQPNTSGGVIGAAVPGSVEVASPAGMTGAPVFTATASASNANAATTSVDVSANGIVPSTGSPPAGFFSSGPGYPLLPNSLKPLFGGGGGGHGGGGKGGPQQAAVASVTGKSAVAVAPVQIPAAAGLTTTTTIVVATTPALKAGPAN